MTIINDRLPAIETLVLAEGAHEPPTNGVVDACIMEAVAWVAGEPWSDHPACASQVIGAFLRSWNDTLPDDARQTLKPYVARLVGSAGTTEQEDARAWMALDWLVRTYAPAWLRLAGLTAQADTLAGLGEFMAGMDVPAIRPTINAVRMDADAAGDAAWDAAGAAAGAAARDAAWDAAWAAAGAAARAAAGAAAWDAAGDAAWAAAGAAAGAAARDAAWDAAWAAAGAAARAAAGAAARDAAGDAAWAAARAAARERLAPTVTELQTAAHGLVDRMLAVTET